MIDKFKAKFVEESMDNAHDLEEALFLLEKDMSNKELIERIFRAMHSLKGGGAMFGFNHLSEFTHHLETVFDWVRTNKLAVSTELISLTFTAVDHINHLLRTGDLTNEKELGEQNALVQEIKEFLTISSIPSSGLVHSSVLVEEDKVEVKTYLITFIPQPQILQNGTNPLYLLDDVHALGKAITVAFTHNIPPLELLNTSSSYCIWQIILSTSEPVNEIRDVFIFVEDECELRVEQVSAKNIVHNPETRELVEKALQSNVLLSTDDFYDEDWETKQGRDGGERKKIATKEHKISSIRVSSPKIDELVTLVSELVTIQAQLSLYAEHNTDPTLLALSEDIQKLARQLRENAFDISLIPLQNELLRFQRLVRDLSKEQNKEIDFLIEGSDLELDKNIIEHLTDPLLHILRNSIDHGIELPKERASKGKSPKGTIMFKAYYSGAYVIIEISDDGQGIDPDFIRQKAISKGIIEDDVILTEKETLDLLFVSGFTTRDTVSGVSGRGVGMDVVKRKIANIRGEVAIDSQVGKGTIISLKLPLTLSIIDGLLVRVGSNQYVFPISAIDKIYALDNAQVKDTFNNVIVIENEQIPFIDLRKIFNAPLSQADLVQVVMLKSEDKKTGIIVDSILGEFQTVVKPLGRYLKKQELISGASIMGDGTISMVIDTASLLQTRKNIKVTGS